MTFQHGDSPSWPLVIGHRGGAGHALENSLAAFGNAAGPGPFSCDGVELDVHAAADGTLVVHHDPVLASGARIGQLSGEDLARERLRDGTPVPTLSALLPMVRQLRLFIEVKELHPEADRALLDLLRAETGKERLQCHSFDHRIVRRLKEQAPWLHTGVLSASYPVDPLAQVRAAGADALWQESWAIDAPLATACREAGIELFAWTVNRREEATRLAGLGVTGLCGDYPERLRREYQQPIKKG